MSVSRDTSDTLTAVLDKVRALGPTLRERALEAERAGRLSDDTIADLDATGAFDIGSPAEFGGHELTVRQQLDVVSEVSKWDGSAGWIVWVGASTNWIPAGCGTRVVKEVYAPEWVGPRIAGSSHFPASRGRAKRVDGGWIVSGGPWTFGSGSLWAPYTNLGCIADGGDGPYLVGIQVPREELRFLDDWKVAGMRGTGSVSSTLVQNELFVPEHRGVDFRDVTGQALENGLAGSLWKAPTLGWAFSLMAGMSIGIAQGALERFLERSAGRPIRGTTYKNQLEAPLTHLMLAEVHAKIQSATALTRANAEETDRLGSWPPPVHRPTASTCRSSVPGSCWRRPTRPSGARKRSSCCSGTPARPRSWRASRFSGPGATHVSSPCTAHSTSKPSPRTTDG